MGNICKSATTSTLQPALFREDSIINRPVENREDKQSLHVVITQH